MTCIRFVRIVLLVFPMLSIGQDLFLPMVPPPPPPPPKAPEVKSFTIHVNHRPNDPASVHAKDVLRMSFCKKFEVVPCTVNSKTDEPTLRLIGDLVVNVPYKNFLQVVTWFQQHRISRLNPPASVDLALSVHPDTEAGLPKDFDFALWAGESYPIDMEGILASAHEASPEAMQTTAREDQDKWAYTCSYDAGGHGQWVDLCSRGPFALNTTCRSTAAGAHIHLFYSSANSDEVAAKAVFAGMATKALNLSLEICHDDYGHEQPHNATCWLGGPTHLPLASGSAGPPHAGSFTREHFSLYVTREDFSKVVGWVMLHDISEVIGQSLDFLLHPVFGCNFADHQMWSLHKGNTPNNMYGIEDEGGWSGKTPSRLDPFGPEAGASCVGGKPDAPRSYEMFLLYDPTSPSSALAKHDFVERIAKAFDRGHVKFVDDVSDPFKDPKSPFLIGCVSYAVNTDIYAKLLPWLSKERGSTDVLLVPLTNCGRKYDYIESGLWLGNVWPLNVAALDKMLPRMPSTPIQARALRGRTSAEALSVYDFLLYVNYASANSYQVAAVEKFLSTFSSVMNVSRKECTSQYPALEPAYTKLCMMNEVLSPTATDPVTTAYAAIYVPATSAASALAWAMTHRSATELGYQIDLLIVPLTGDALYDYARGAFHAGTVWTLNTHAILASTQNGETRSASLPSAVHYYRSDNVDQRTELGNGVVIERWEVERDFKADWPLQAPFVVRHTIPVGAEFPSWGAFWYASDAHATVITGNATFGNDSSAVFGYGDLFWALAGQPQGPIKNVGSTPLTVLTVSTAPVLARRAYEAPSNDNPSVDKHRTTSRGYRQVDAMWGPNPSPHTTECMANGGVLNAGFDGDQYTEPVLRVKWAPNCSIPYHYHPTGALYFIQYGTMFFRGDLVGKDLPIRQGEVRWVRPGFDYGPEYNSADAPMEITVLGTDTPPMFQAPPSGPYKYQKSVTVTAIFDETGGNVDEL